MKNTSPSRTVLALQDAHDRLAAENERLQAKTDVAADLAMDQPPTRDGWYRVRAGLWRNRQTGEVWRSWREYGARAGHYPGADWARAAAREARAAESRFAVQLRQVARQIGDMVRGVFNPANPADPGWEAIEEMLRQYRDMLRPWAQATAQRMLTDVSRRDAASWHRLGQQIGRALKQEVERAPTADALQELYNQQVTAIMDLPANAAERLRQSKEASADIVWELRDAAREAMVTGRRWEDLLRGETRQKWQDIVDKANDAGLTARANAETVARTEVARAHSTLQAVRAKHMGSELFQWKTANDLEVRDLHRELSQRNVGYGQGIYRWDDPPELDDGRPGFPGTIFNCRCYAMPVLPAIE